MDPDKEKGKMEKIKVYVEVHAVFTMDGRLLPVSFTWEDGQRYKIDRITECARCASMKAGGTGMRYTCIVGGRECHLFYEENLKWFMERKTA